MLSQREHDIVIKGAGYCHKGSCILSLRNRILSQFEQDIVPKGAEYYHKGSMILSQKEHDIVTKGAVCCH